MRFRDCYAMNTRSVSYHSVLWPSDHELHFCADNQDFVIHRDCPNRQFEVSNRFLIVTVLIGVKWVWMLEVCIFHFDLHFHFHRFPRYFLQPPPRLFSSQFAGLVGIAATILKPGNLQSRPIQSSPDQIESLLLHRQSFQRMNRLQVRISWTDSFI
jgi:hypothetical protein